MHGIHVKVNFFSVQHEGIALGDGTVVHVFSDIPLAPIQTIARHPVNVFSRGKHIVKVDHAFSPRHGHARDPEIIAKTALGLVNNSKFYFLFTHNCEHFATSCVYEKGPYSDQVKQEMPDLLRAYHYLGKAAGKALRFKKAPFFGYEVARHGMKYLFSGEVEDDINSLCSFTQKGYAGSEYLDKDGNYYIYVHNTKVQVNGHAFRRTGWHTINRHGVTCLSEYPEVPFVIHHDLLFNEHGHQYIRGSSTDYEEERVHYD